MKTEADDREQNSTETLSMFRLEPDWMHSSKLNYFKLGYFYLYERVIRQTFTKAMILVMLFQLAHLRADDVMQLWSHLQNSKLTSSIVAFVFLLFMGISYVICRQPSVYLIDFACFRPPSHLRAPFSAFIEHSILGNCFNEKSREFQNRILARSGLGELTVLPESIHYLPPMPDFTAARRESEMVIFAALDELLEKTGVRPKDIDILITNCSLFNPTPSLSSMIVNHYKMRSNILSYHLSGMGCSAGVISIDLAKELLHVHSNKYAIVVSTENITQNVYFGNRRSMLLPNCLFRVGGAAVLLSNKSIDRSRAKYQLLYTVRTHKGAVDGSYRCVFQEQDEEGKTGVTLTKDLMLSAGDALKTNISSLGPLVLPLSEQLIFVAFIVAKKLFNSKIKSYIPDFKRAFEHFCIHAGGKTVIDVVEKTLKLESQDVESSRMTLYRFGNTSSSSIWYELAYIEAKCRMKKGDRTWQIAFGSGFKCNSAVWRALRDIGVPKCSPWIDCIHDLPVKIPEVIDF
ncbi:hypothetical protein O6H91_13G075500 [Diphasiastrum complanatum]|uniref:Uncharacterized protein n=2 Tax=Diphasiastrum complanatum TaxID=34168 RepID=A0ACC2BWA2_DIPCM|nr:hypothetical protein O6H91_13G075300 [Diphasiastrum complanatum]KAJ7534008.1 hypothetical protein O6H91_13G075500 [Diphasiastrum complanatum]